MMHVDPRRQAQQPDPKVHGELLAVLTARVEACRALVTQAGQMADRSLLRVNEASLGHAAGDPGLAGLLEAHLREREALFEAMRALEAACRDLEAAGG